MDDDRLPSHMVSLTNNILNRNDEGRKAQIAMPSEDKPRPRPMISNPNYRTKVCIHWFQNKCSKGDNCEFLHE